MKQTKLFLGFIFCLIVISCQKEHPPIDQVLPLASSEVVAVTLADTVPSCDMNYFIDLDLDGIDDLRFSGYCTHVNPGHYATGQSCFSLDPSVTIAVEEFTDYQCLDTLNATNGDEGFYYYMCDETSANIYETNTYKAVNTYTSIYDIQVSTEDFREDVYLIRNTVDKVEEDTYPGFYNQNLHAGSPLFAAFDSGFFLIKKEGIYYAVEYLKNGLDFIFVQFFKIE